jgi:hypothetical protein
VKWYRALLEGKGFEIILERRVVAVGFFVTRFVQSSDEEEAASRATTQIEELLQPPRIVSRRDGWTLRVQEVEEAVAGERPASQPWFCVVRHGRVTADRWGRSHTMREASGSVMLMTTHAGRPTTVLGSR